MAKSPVVLPAATAAAIHLDLLFLKEQFKHSRLSMTQFYAADPMQEEALYEDLFSEIALQKVQLVEGWLSADQPLAGRAGRAKRLNQFVVRVGC